MHRRIEDTGEGPALSTTAFIRRLGEGDYAPHDDRIRTLDLLTRAGLPVPDGFVLTTKGHREFVRASGLEAEIRSLARREEGAGRLIRIRDCGFEGRLLGAALERAIRDALLDLGARTVIVSSGQDLRRGLGTIPAVVSAVREAWLSVKMLERQIAAAASDEILAWPVLVQREPQPEYTGWTATADLPGAAPRHRSSGGESVPLNDVEPSVGARPDFEGISRLTAKAASVLDEPVRLVWDLESGRWLLISVDQDLGSRGG